MFLGFYYNNKLHTNVRWVISGFIISLTAWTIAYIYCLHNILQSALNSENSSFRKFRSDLRKFRASEIHLLWIQKVTVSGSSGQICGSSGHRKFRTNFRSLFRLAKLLSGVFTFISGSWSGSSGGAELPPFVSEVPAVRRKLPNGQNLKSINRGLLL